ncbi:CPBP family intramembrane metalloprotease [Patescibacteria group bacterium]|nr:CPBP family intramembrane metalloprotease [Patescibacteria group bacterium]
MPKKEVAIKHTTILATYLLIVWGFYRLLFFKLPEDVEELIIKPLVWLVPVFILLRKEKLGLSSIGVTSKNIFPSIYLSLALGVVFAIEGFLINIIKYKGIDFSANIGNNPLLWALVISLATAVSEELTFRGYIFGRIWSALGSELWANFLTSFLWALIHIPIAIFWWKLNLAGTIGLLTLTTIFGIGSAIIYARTKNILASVLLHLFWEWPIILFR